MKRLLVLIGMIFIAFFLNACGHKTASSKYSSNTVPAKQDVNAVYPVRIRATGTDDADWKVQGNTEAPNGAIVYATIKGGQRSSKLKNTDEDTMDSTVIVNNGKFHGNLNCVTGQDHQKKNTKMDYYVFATKKKNITSTKYYIDYISKSILKQVDSKKFIHSFTTTESQIKFLDKISKEADETSKSNKNNSSQDGVNDSSSTEEESNEDDLQSQVDDLNKWYKEDYPQKVEKEFSDDGKDYTDSEEFTKDAVIEGFELSGKDLTVVAHRSTMKENGLSQEEVAKYGLNVLLQDYDKTLTGFDNVKDNIASDPNTVKYDITYR